MLRIHLRYLAERKRAITELKRASKPSVRVYVSREEIPRIKDGLGTAVLTTSRGVLSDNKARELGVGGEVLCYVW